ncbi:hypothetical protein F4Z99_01140, partial [Candidatus Poribacteria bacterium]|nr:hypothetical protein [Candidatus Poribacteria bacterium]
MKDQLFNRNTFFSVLAILICLTFTTISFTTISYSQDGGEVLTDADADADAAAAADDDDDDDHDPKKQKQYRLKHIKKSPRKPKDR